MKLLHIVGARPNFPKLAPVHRAARALGLDQIIVHTGQHYDEAMSANFFRDLGIPAPDVNLEVGSGTHATQTAKIIERFEPVLLEHRPDWLVVYGDVNSTMATAIVASKLGCALPMWKRAPQQRPLDAGGDQSPGHRPARQSAPLRRWTPSHIVQEGEPADEIVFVGNVIDTLFASLPREKNPIRRAWVPTLHMW